MPAARRGTVAVLGLLALTSIACGSRALPTDEQADAGATDPRKDAATGSPDATVGADARPLDAAPKPDAASDLGPSGAACFRAAVALPLVTNGGVAFSGPLRPEPLPAPPPQQRWGDPNRLPPHELARRLAALVWKGEPGALGDRIAACGKLAPGDVEVLVRQMLMDPRAVRGIEAFTTWWLNLEEVARLERDPALYPGFGPELRKSITEEPRRLVVDVVLKGDGRFPALLTAPYSLVDGPLAALYGRPFPAPSSTPIARLDFRPEDQRAGLLTQPAVLVQGTTRTRNSPPNRARFVRSRVLCQEIPDPPPDLPPPLPELGPGQTLRQVIDRELERPVCQACHTLMEIGYAYELFDVIGRFRATENGVPIDARVRTRDPDDRQISGPVELAAWLARTEAATTCHARKWMEYALGRHLVSAEDGAMLEGVVSRFRAANLDLRALIAAVAMTESFLAP